MGHKKLGSKAPLKAALHSQQSRLKKKEEASRAALLAEQKTKGRKDTQRRQPKGKEKERLPAIAIPFLPTDRILLIGEGNFSFAQALVDNPPQALETLPPASITATAYDSEEECYIKYPDAQRIVESLRKKGVEVLFAIDATKLNKLRVMKGRTWDRIVWNFPHAGKGITDQDRNILSNQMMILDFLKSAAGFLVQGLTPMSNNRKRNKSSSADDEDMSEDENQNKIDDAFGPEDASLSQNQHDSFGQRRGTILITLRNVPPYTLWDVPKLAKNPPPPPSSSVSTKQYPRYLLLRSFKFHRSVWKGYQHKMSKGERAHGHGTTGIGGEDRTWEFCLRD